MINYLNNLDGYKKYFDISFDITPYKGFDTGAFIWAYRKWDDEYYIFLQESLEVNDLNWFKTFKSFREKNTLNSWCVFDLVWDNNVQREGILSKISDNNLTLEGLPIGVFGNMFQISKNDLSLIDKKYNLDNFIPNDKIYGSCAMERGWAYLSKNCGININSIDGKYSPNEHDYKNKLFQKRFHFRS
jgi:hypothetical protein